MPNHGLSINEFRSYWDTQLAFSLNYRADGPGGAFVGHLSNYGNVYSNAFGLGITLAARSEAVEGCRDPRLSTGAGRNYG